MNNLFLYDKEISKEGLLAGVDEAGRGPLAGPVVAAAVILKDDYYSEILNDSKKLSEKKRDILYTEIIENAVSYAVSFVSPQVIDEINILNATMKAMSEAVEGLSNIPTLTLIDGNKVPQGLENAVAVIKGDATSAAIAAASIIAKVERDRFMQNLPSDYDKYLFLKHKGYGTKLHYEMIEEHGVSDIHRRSFLKKILKDG